MKSIRKSITKTVSNSGLNTLKSKEKLNQSGSKDTLPTHVGNMDAQNSPPPRPPKPPPKASTEATSSHTPYNTRSEHVPSVAGSVKGSVKGSQVNLDDNGDEFKSNCSLAAQTEVEPTVDAAQCEIPLDRLKGMSPQQQISLLQECLSDYRWQLENENIILTKLNEYTNIKGERSRKVFVEYMDQSRIVHMNRDILSKAIHAHEQAVVGVEMQIVATSNARLKHRYSELNAEMDMMKDDHRDQLTRLDKGRAMLTQRTKELNAQIDDLKEENGTLEKKLLHLANTRDAENGADSDANDAQAALISSLQEDNDRLGVEVKEARVFVKERKARESETTEKVGELEGEIKELKDRCEAHTHSLIRVEQQLKDKVVHVTTLEGRLEVATRTAHDYEMQLSSAMADRALIQAQVEAQEKLAAQQKKQIADLTQQKEDILGTAEQHQKYLERTQADLMQTEDDKQRQIIELAQQAERITQLSAAMEKLKIAASSGSSMNEEFLQVNKDLEQAHSDLHTIKKREAEYVYTIGRLSEKQDKFKADKHAADESLRQLVERHQKEMAEARREMDAQVSDLTQTLRGINDTKEKEKAEVIRLKDKELNEITRLRTDAINNQQKEIDALAAEHTAAVKAKEKLAKDLSRSRDRSMALEKEVFAHVSTNTDLNNRLMQVTERMDDAKQRIEELELVASAGAGKKKNMFGL